jgi:hypothetical protein
MGDDYLWDKSGPPDPEVARLERLLGRYRYEPGGAPAPTLAPPRRRALRALFWSGAIAAGLVAAWALVLRPRGSGPLEGYRVVGGPDVLLRVG